MTFGEMYSLMQTLIDKSGSPYFPQTQFDQIANLVYSDYVENELDNLEADEEFTSRVDYLYKTYKKLNSSVIDVATDIPDFRRRIRINIRYQRNCNGVITYPYTPVIKARNNEIDMLQRDPFNKGIDDEPLFLVTESGGKVVWEIFATQTPSEINVTYIRTPQVINSATSPNTVFEAPDDVAQQIVNFISDNMDIIIENYNRAEMKQRFLARFISVPTQPNAPRGTS